MTLVSIHKKAPTRKEILKQYKGARNLRIETDPDNPDAVSSVSYEQPCIVCGKYHRFMSKPQMRCAAKIVGGVYCAMNEEETE